MFKKWRQPEIVFYSLDHLRALQNILVDTGTPIYWFDDLPIDHPAFAAAQYLAIADIMPGDNKHLHYYPDEIMSVSEMEFVLTKISSSKKAQIIKEMKKLPQSLTRAQFAIWLYSKLNLI